MTILLNMRFLFILLVSTICHAQPKGTNIIKVTGVTFKQVAQSLVDNGFYFEKIDSNFQILRTEYNTVKGYDVSYEVRVKDSVATMKGSWKSGNILFGTQNQKYSPYRQIFALFNEFALSFNKPVEYIKE